MAQKFKEVAHLRTDLNKYGEGYDRIFGKKEKTTLQKIEAKDVTTIATAPLEVAVDLTKAVVKPIKEVTEEIVEEIEDLTKD